MPLEGWHTKEEFTPKENSHTIKGGFTPHAPRTLSCEKGFHAYRSTSRLILRKVKGAWKKEKKKRGGIEFFEKGF